jgi:hypothetical protein
VPQREEIWALTGITAIALAKRVKKALKGIDQAMRATKTQRLVVPGTRERPTEVKTFTDPDHETRLDANEQLFKLVGMYAPRERGGAQSKADGQTVTLNVTLRDMAPHLQAEPAAASSVPPLVKTADGTWVAPEQ